jgi:hypothetical protein
VANPAHPATAFYLVRSGEVLLLPGSVQVPAGMIEVDVAQAQQVAVGSLAAGSLYNETVLCAPAAPLQVRGTLCRLCHCTDVVLADLSCLPAASVNSQWPGMWQGGSSARVHLSAFHAFSTLGLLLRTRLL